jgi:hypothetical protein
MLDPNVLTICGRESSKFSPKKKKKTGDDHDIVKRRCSRLRVRGVFLKMM